MIRRARAEDIPAAAALMAKAYAVHFRPIIGEAALGFDQAHFEARFARDLADLAVLDEGGLQGLLLLIDKQAGLSGQGPSQEPEQGPTDQCRPGPGRWHRQGPASQQGVPRWFVVFHP